MTKRATPFFRVAEYESGQPWIVLEQYDGENLVVFQRTVGFDLPPGTTLEEAVRICDGLSQNLIAISETD